MDVDPIEERRQQLREARSAAVETGLTRQPVLDPIARGLLLFLVVAGGCIAATTSTEWPVRLAVIALVGYMFFSLPSLSHEALHGHLAKASWINRAIGVATSVISLIPFSTFKAYHLYHHAHAGEEDDPEPYPTPFSRLRFLTYPFEAMGFGLYLWSFAIKTLFGRPPHWIRTERQIKNVKQESIVIFALTAALIAVVVGFGHSLWVVWPAPVPLAALLFSYTAMPEHFGARGRISPTPDQLEYTVTVDSNPITRFVVWNTNFHAAHHFMPTVPSKHLPALDRLIRPFQPSEWRFSGYVHWYMATLRGLKTSRWNAPVEKPQSPVAVIALSGAEAIRESA